MAASLNQELLELILQTLNVDASLTDQNLSFPPISAQPATWNFVWLVLMMILQPTDRMIGKPVLSLFDK